MRESFLEVEQCGDCGQFFYGRCSCRTRRPATSVAAGIAAENTVDDRVNLANEAVEDEEWDHDGWENE